MSALTEPGGEPLPGDDRRLRVAGYLVVLVVFGGFGGWAAIAPLDSAALAPGVVTVQSYRKTIQHLEGGIVRSLHVQEGQQVAKDALLVELEGTQFQAEMDVLLAHQLALQSEEARLLAERDGLDAVAYPSARGLAETDPRVVEARQSQDTLFAARRKAYTGEISVLEQSIAQLETQIRGLSSVMVSKGELVESYSVETKDLRALLADGFADRQRLRDVERKSTEVQGEIAELYANIAAAEGGINEARLRMIQVGREFQSGVAQDLGEVRARLADVNERIAGASDRVDRAFIRAPVAGRVLQLAVHTVGGVVAPGQPIMDVVPEEETLLVEARVSPLDIDRVHAGLPARLRFSGLKRTRVPEVNGTVTSISADRLEDRMTGESYFLARVEIDSDELDKLDGVELKPGMPVEAMVNTGSRTMLEYLWEPVGESVSRALRED
jgi:membrane fusion protein, epimerase transport system